MSRAVIVVDTAVVVIYTVIAAVVLHVVVVILPRLLFIVVGINVYAPIFGVVAGVAGVVDVHVADVVVVLFQRCCAC